MGNCRISLENNRRLLRNFAWFLITCSTSTFICYLHVCARHQCMKLKRFQTSTYIFSALFLFILELFLSGKVCFFFSLSHTHTLLFSLASFLFVDVTCAEAFIWTLSVVYCCKAMGDCAFCSYPTEEISRIYVREVYLYVGYSLSIFTGAVADADSDAGTDSFFHL